MTGPRILLTSRWPDQVEAEFRRRFDVVLNDSGAPMTRGDLVRAMGEFDALCVSVCDRIDDEILCAGQRTRLIANYGVGYDHIDVEAARARGVAVTNTPGVVTEATADLALTLMLMVARRAGEGERMVRAGQWKGWHPMQLVGSALGGKVLGVVGLGRIGAATARRARHGFGMRIAYHGRHEADPRIVGELEAEFHADQESLLRVSDFVSLHVPGGSDTAALIDAEALRAMKPGAFLINTARGGVVDCEALAAALRDKRIAGAGLDVYPEEPRVPEALLGLENVVLLPHLGSADAETRIAMGMRVLDNVVAWSAGTAPPDRVT